MSTAVLKDALYERALELVRTYRAASVVLVQRHLHLSWKDAESLLQRMAQETMSVRRTSNGLFIFIENLIGEELQTLHSFAQEVVLALAAGELDAGQLRRAAIRYGLAEEVAPSDCTTSSAKALRPCGYLRECVQPTLTPASA
ncbi:DNA translocase FtsK [Cupriavidus sp. 8B]